MKRLLKSLGFTLIEMLLVLVIIGSLIYASITYMEQRAESMRVDRTVAQMQQILNAALAYYIAESKWPTSVTDLTGTYMMQANLINPWGQPYKIAVSTDAQGFPLFYLYTTVKTTGKVKGQTLLQANLIASALPISYVSADPTGTPPVPSQACTTASRQCAVVTSVTIPGQNLNNATAVNYAGIYEPGACIPVPSCPVDLNNNRTVPQAFVSPVSISGFNDPGNATVYPISSFTAYYVGGDSTTPPACNTYDTPEPCSYYSTTVPAPAYWRACLQIMTEKGDVAASNPNWEKDVKLMAFTRCEITTTTQGGGGGGGTNIFTTPRPGPR